MADEEFDIGDIVVMTHSVSVGGTPVDPTNLIVDVLSPGGVPTHAEYAGGSGLIARDGTGVYVFEIAPTESGKWWARWAAVGGNVQEAEEVSFRVRRRRVAAP